MIIGIELNEVLRDFTRQFEYVYNKYQPNGVEINLLENPVKSMDLVQYYPFSGGTDAMNKFLYEEAALEVFGHAAELKRNYMTYLNHFSIEVADEGKHELWIISREANRSIPATHFFLSKTSCMVGNIRFYTKYTDEWNDVDVLVTANPRVLDCKPQGKISVKIKAPYNGNSKADYTFDSIIDFINSNEMKLLSPKKIKLLNKKKNENKGISGHWWGRVLHQLKGVRIFNKN